MWIQAWGDRIGFVGATPVVALRGKPYAFDLTIRQAS